VVTSGNISTGAVPIHVQIPSLLDNQSFNWVINNLHRYSNTKRRQRVSQNQLLKQGLILHVTERYEFFSVIGYNPISSEREIPKIHRIPQKRV
jgi:hypothetical protein